MRTTGSFADLVGFISREMPSMTCFGPVGSLTSKPFDFSFTDLSMSEGVTVTTSILSSSTSSPLEGSFGSSLDKASAILHRSNKSLMPASLKYLSMRLSVPVNDHSVRGGEDVEGVWRGMEDVGEPVLKL